MSTSKCILTFSKEFWSIYIISLFLKNF